jgi:hypothetical protein
MASSTTAPTQNPSMRYGSHGQFAESHPIGGFVLAWRCRLCRERLRRRTATNVTLEVNGAGWPVLAGFAGA